MASFADTLGSIQTLLAPYYKLTPKGVEVVFSASTFDCPVFAVGDTHLCGGDGGDVFLFGKPEKARRLTAVLRAILAYQQHHPQASRAIQLGDWFDIWRVCGDDPPNMAYGKIQNVELYADIFAADADLGLAHVIGNHDGAFLNSLPDARATQPQLFRLGFWLGGNVYALHGHQSSIQPPPESSFDEAIVQLATTLGGFMPGSATFQEYCDRLGVGPGIGQWLCSLLLGRNMDVDPGPQPREVDTRPVPASIRAAVKSATFAVREDIDTLAKVVQQVEGLSGSHGRKADMVLVGHSHRPCIAWSDAADRPILFADAGAWVGDQANLLIAADDTLAVFDVVPG